MRALRGRSNSAGGAAPQLDHHLLVALRCMKEYCAVAKPRRIRMLASPRPALVFTDGACEQDGEEVTFGRVILEDAWGPL